MSRHSKLLAGTYHGYTILDSLQGFGQQLTSIVAPFSLYFVNSNRDRVNKIIIINYLYKRIILTHDVQGAKRLQVAFCLRYDMLKKYEVTRECQISPIFGILHMLCIGTVCIAIFYQIFYLFFIPL